MGITGSVRELLRHVRISRVGAPDYAFARPDQPAPWTQATDPIRPAGSDVDTAS